MENYYKVIVTTTYVTERIVKADSKKDVEDKLDNIVKTIDLLDDVPDIECDIEVRPDMDDDDVEIDLTKKGK